MLNKILLGAVILLAIGLGVVYFVQPSPQVVEKIVEKIGALPGPEISDNCLSIGGVQSCYYHEKFKTGTTTLCAIKSPAATSTLVSASVEFTVGSSTATAVDLAKATTAFATTTLLGQSYTLPANGQATILASTTGVVTVGSSSVSASQIGIFSPSNWFVVKMDNGYGGAKNSPKGYCMAEFRNTQ